MFLRRIISALLPPGLIAVELALIFRQTSHAAKLFPERLRLRESREILSRINLKLLYRTFCMEEGLLRCGCFMFDQELCQAEAKYCTEG